MKKLIAEMSDSELNLYAGKAQKMPVYMGKGGHCWLMKDSEEEIYDPSNDTTQAWPIIWDSEIVIDWENKRCVLREDDEHYLVNNFADKRSALRSAMIVFVGSVYGMEVDFEDSTNDGTAH